MVGTFAHSLRPVKHVKEDPDVSGILSVKEPDTFLATLGTGLGGRARAFGCGLMLIRRV